MKIDKIILIAVAVAIVTTCIATVVQLEMMAQATSVDVEDIGIKVYTENGELIEQGYAILTVDGEDHLYTIDEQE